MIFDSTLLAALAHDIKQLRGERLRDLWQANASTSDNSDARKSTETNEGRAVYLVFRDATLLIDTHPQHARLHLISNAPNPPSTPTALTGLLRKTLRGALLIDVEQPNFDRILHLKFEARDDVGDVRIFTLVAEMMDRRSNLVLLDGEGVIMDAVKRLPPFLNRARTILPHRAYEPPPTQKRDPLAVSDWATAVAQLVEEENDASAHEASIDSISSFIDALRARFCGISPLVAHAIEAKIRELQSIINGESQASASFDQPTAAQACDWFFANANRVSRGDFKPVVCGDQPYPFALPGRECVAASTSEMSTHVARVVAKEVKPQLLQTERARLLSHLGHREKLVAAQQGDVEKALRHAREATTFNHWGQLLLAHIPLVEEAARRQQTFVDVPDDFAAPLQDESDVPDNSTAENSASGAVRAGWARIPIEPKWTAPDNAARLFERYRRARKLGLSAPDRQTELEGEAQRLAAWRAQALAAQTEDELRHVAIESGLEAVPEKDAPRQLSRSKQQELDARPENKLRHRDYEGWQLWIGRNALENQILLSKVASPSDVWMHVRGMPSAHVLIKAQKGKTPPPLVLEEGARWVANASRAGGRNNVPDREGQGERVEIIYTQAKWVRAVKGTPGRVTLQRFQTMTIRA